MSWKKEAIAIFPLFLFIWCCTKPPESSFQVYRFIDHLDKDSILESPLSHPIEESQETSFFYPFRSHRLQDSGSGENPHEVKRKLRIEGSEINILFAPPKSTYSFELDIPGDGVLEFGIGLLVDENSESQGLPDKVGSKGVNFLVILEASGRKMILFQKYLSPPSQKEKSNLTYISQALELPWPQKNARITFQTKGEGRSFSFWYNPVLYKKGENDRNVILISIDTLRADHLGCYGYWRDTSPNIDALTSDSVIFQNTYASSPWTLPSHVSLLTSLHGVHHQVYFDDQKMDPSIITLADILRRNNFFCSAITGGGFVSSVYGFSKGFDSYREGEGGVFRQDSAKVLSDAVSEWLDREKEKKFFLFVHTYQPHSPYACPSPYKTLFLDEKAKWGHIDLISHIGGKAGLFQNLPEEERQNIISLYDAEIRYTDERLIGPLLKKLKDLGLYDRSLIIITSDHGEEFYDHKAWGHGHSLYDESLKVPLLIKFPDSKYKGKKIHPVVALVDIMPTVLEVLEIDFSHSQIDGRSLIPVVEGREKEDRTFLADIGDNVLSSHIPKKIAMNKGKGKFILNQEYGKEDLGFFLTPPPPLTPVEFYDLLEDPAERNNIADEHASQWEMILQRIDEIYSKAPKRKTEKPVIDKKMREQLKALGYIR